MSLRPSSDLVAVTLDQFDNIYVTDQYLNTVY